MDMIQGLCIDDVEELVTSLVMDKDKSKFEDNSPYTLLALLGPHIAGPMMNDGWFAADFAMAHQIYGNLSGEQTWMCAVDLLEEVETGGPYFWGYPKHSRLQVLARDDPRFYSLSASWSLLSDFKKMLIEIVARLSATDRLLLLIFAHGDEEPDKNGVMSGILVGEGDQDGFGVMYTSELNSMLSSCLAKVTLITSACFGGAWHHESRTTYSAAGNVETLSVPESASRSYRGGYFWEAMWYELSRLGLRLPEKPVEESHKFKEGVCRVRDRLMDLMSLNPEPSISVASEIEWEHHFCKVIQLDEYQDQSPLTFLMILPNPTTNSVSDAGAVSSTSVGSSAGALGWAGADSAEVAGDKLASHLGLKDSDMQALLSLGSHKETILPSHPTIRNDRWVPGTKSYCLRLRVISLSVLVDYYVHSMPGLHNLPCNIPTHMLLWKYWKMTATKEELEKLRQILQYRMVQDTKAEEILSFMNISRFCSITKFRMEHHWSKEQAPYLRIVRMAHLFDKAPKVSPPCHTYTKPMYYLANTAFRNKMDLEWWRKSLDACHDYFEDFQRHYLKMNYDDLLCRTPEKSHKAL